MNEFEVFIDLDGVLADYETRFMSVFGIHPSEVSAIEDMGDKARHYKFYALHILRGDFFNQLGIMPGAVDMVEFIMGVVEPEILSAAGTNHVAISCQQKARWTRNNFPPMKYNFVEHSEEKAAFAHARAILIDDREKSIDPWVEAGGIGILHTSPEDTIEQLTQIINSFT
jgi:5'(3')-deoxyribonucleotidase